MKGIGIRGAGIIPIAMQGGGQGAIDTLSPLITAWQAGADRVFYGGIDSSTFGTTATIDGNALPGRTFISGVVTERMRQDGYIRQIDLQVSAVGNALGWKAKVFRPNGANYDFVSESEFFTPAGSGLRTVVFATPMACQPGDILGITLRDNTNQLKCVTKAATPNSIRWTAGDIVGTDAFATTISNLSLCIEGSGTKPYLAVSGDSIPEGHNTASRWHSFYDTGPAGTATSEIMNQLRGLIGTGSLLEYQNHANGGEAYDWVAATGIVSSLTTLSRAVLLHCGVNDVSDGRLWAAVEADLDTIAAAVAAAATPPLLFVDEILPWTAGSDAQAATVRTFNGNIATWCTANGAYLVSCHDAMGQIRISTGELDDLLAAYDQDGVHLTQAGVNAMAAIWKTALETNT